MIINTTKFMVLCFLLSAVDLSAQLVSTTYISYDENKGTFQLNNVPDLIPYGTDIRNRPFWEYFWEFGDGHFSTEETPVHHYSVSGKYNIVLHLSPRYAQNKPRNIFRPLEVRGSRQDSLIYDLEGKRVFLELNTPTSVVPGQEINLALMYGNRTFDEGIRDGYLFFFYNQSGEIPVSYKPFALGGDPRTYFDPVLDPSAISPVQIANRITASGIRKAVLNDLNIYENALVFQVTDLGAEEQRNIFLSLRVDPRLMSQQNRDRKLSLAAVFVPTKGEFYRQEHRVEKELVILAVHDPNRIRTDQDLLHFNRNAKRRLTYTIDFQNTQGGIADDVIVRFPLDPSLNPESVRLLASDPYLPSCPTDQPADSLSCITLETARSGDFAEVRFHNIGLAGAKSFGLFQNKNASRGTIQLSVQSNRNRTAKTESFAEIFFDEQEAIRTNIAQTNWRRRSWFLRPQFELGLSGEVFFFDPPKILDRLGGGLAIVDAPLSGGVAYGLEVSYSSLTFSRQQELFDEFEDFIRRKEYTRLQLLDLNFLIGYQPRNGLRLSTGLGVSLPLWAGTRLTEETEVFIGNSSSLVTTNELQTRYGLLASSPTRNNNFYTNPIPQPFGAYWRVALELGVLDKVTLGVSHDVRYFPSLYFDACGYFRTYALFAKFRLFDTKFAQ